MAHKSGKANYPAKGGHPGKGKGKMPPKKMPMTKKEMDAKHKKMMG